MASAEGPFDGLGDRFLTATTALRQAQLEIKKLREERAEFTSRMESMNAFFQSRMESQRSELQRLRDQFEETKKAVDGCIAALHSNCQKLIEKSKRTVSDVHNEKKLLIEQLEIKKLKLSHLTRRMDVESKQTAKLKRIIAKLTAGDKDGALIIRCIRCKARKRVLKKVEQEYAEAITTKETVEKRLEEVIKEKDGAELRYKEAKGELAKTKDQLLQARRANVVLEQELCDEKKKGAAFEIEAQEAAAQHQAATVEIARTPTDQQQLLHQHHLRSYQPTSPPIRESSKHEQQMAQLRSMLETKQAEVDEISAARNRLTSDMVFYQHRVEELTLDLENRAQANSQKQTELDEAKQEVQFLRALLENLVAGIATAVTD